MKSNSIINIKKYIVLAHDKKQTDVKMNCIL